MLFNRNIFANFYSETMMSILMLIIQLNGLLLFNWSGLYVIYLCWINLFFLTVYTILRERQLRNNELWKVFRNKRPYLFEEDQKMFFFIRTISLCFYLLLIGFSAIPYERGFTIEDGVRIHRYSDVHSIGEFFTGLLVTDPLFIVSVFLIVSYYLKKLIAKPDTGEEAMIEFSFHFSSSDPNYAYPLLALMTFIIPAAFMEALLKDQTELKSYLFSYAIWLLLFGFLTDLLTRYRIKKVMARTL